ncbi:MAG: hypothetical protein ABIJ46_00120 [bacterium]
MREQFGYQPPEAENWSAEGQRESAEERGPERIEGFDVGLKRIEAKVRQLLAEKDRLLLAVSGKSGSGKTELARQLGERLRGQGVETTVISTDDFYENDDPDNPQKKELNLGRLHDVIAKLQDGHPVDRYEPAPAIIVEGLQTIDDGVVGQAPDLRAYVETGFGQRMGRRLVRDDRNGHRDPKKSLEVFVSVAVNHPELVQKFEGTPDTSGCDFLIENDYREEGDPGIAVRGEELVFTLGGEVRESRKLSKEEKKAVLALGVEEG